MKFKKLLALLMALALVLTSFSFAAAEEEIVEAPAAEEVVETPEEQVAVEELPAEAAPVEGEPEVQEAELPVTDSTATPQMNVRYVVGDFSADLAKKIDVPAAGQPLAGAATLTPNWAAIITAIPALNDADEIGYAKTGWFIIPAGSTTETAIDITAPNTLFADNATLVYKCTAKTVKIVPENGRVDNGETATTRYTDFPAGETVKLNNENVKATYGQAIPSLSDAETNGYNFVEWQTYVVTAGPTKTYATITSQTKATATNGVVEDGADLVMPASALWTAKTYTVTFAVEKANSEVTLAPTSMEVLYNGRIATAPAITYNPVDKYLSTGATWSAPDATGEDVPFVFNETTGTQIKGNTTITLHPKVKTFTVTLTNGSTTMSTMTTQTIPDVAWGTVMDAPDVSETAKEGYKFDKWSVTAPSTTWTFSDPVKTNVAATATWKAKDYDVKFFLDETATTPLGTVSKAYNTAVAGTEEGFPAASTVVKVGYSLSKFNEGTANETYWYTKNDKGEKVPFVVSATTGTTVTSDTNVYANWTVNSYTIKLISAQENAKYPDGTSEGKALPINEFKTVSYGDQLTADDLKNAFMAAGAAFDFKAWTYADKTGAKEVTLPLTIDEKLNLADFDDGDTIVLTATWTPVAVVTFVDALLDEGTTKAHEAQRYELVNGKATLANLPVPKKAGYVFDGWYETLATATTKKVDGDQITASITLNAKWFQELTVTFNADGGSPEVGSNLDPVTLVSSKYYTEAGAPSATFKANKKELPIVTKSGSDFGGWKNGATVITNETAITADCTLVAGWTKIQHKVVVMYNMNMDYTASTGDYTTAADDGKRISKPSDKENGINIFDDWYVYTAADGLSSIPFDFENTTITEKNTIPNDGLDVSYPAETYPRQITIMANWIAPAAEVNGNYYETLEEAVAKATAGQTVKLLSNYTLEDDLSVTAGITLDLNGKTLNLDDNALIADGAELTISGTAGILKNGSLKSNGDAGKVSIVKGTFTGMTYSGTVVIEGGWFDKADVGDAVLKDKDTKKLAVTTASKPYYTPDTFHTLTINWNYPEGTSSEIPATYALQVGSEEKILTVFNAELESKKLVIPEIEGYALETVTVNEKDYPVVYTTAECTTEIVVTPATGLTEDKAVFTNWLIVVTFDTNDGKIANPLYPVPNDAGAENLNEKYNVSYSSDSKKAFLKVKKGTVVAAPREPSKAGYEFAGAWTKPNDPTSGWLFNSPVNAPLTLVAAWTLGNGWTITNVDTDVANQYEIGDGVITYQGYADKFLVFNYTDKIEGMAPGYFIKFTITAPSTVKAKVGTGADEGVQWYFSKDGGTKVKFNGTDGKNDGVENGRLILNVIERIDFSMLKAGQKTFIYTFYDSFANNADAKATITAKVNGTTVNTKYVEFLNKDGKLEANIVKGICTTTVNFKNVPAAAAIAAQTVDSGKAATKPADPKKANAVFVDWYEINKDNFKTNAAGAYVDENDAPIDTTQLNWEAQLVLKSTATKYDFATVLFPELVAGVVEHEVDLWANWKDIVTLTFKDGEKVLDEIIVDKGTTWDEVADLIPDDPTAGKDKIFVGWGKGAAETAFTFVDNTKEAEIATFNALYDDLATVTFYRGETVVLGPTDYPNTKNRKGIEQPEGYEVGKNFFLGWFEKDATVAYDFTTTADICTTGHELKLYAKFSDEYSVATLKSAKLMLEGKIQIAMKFELLDDLLGSNLSVVFSNGQKFTLSGLVKTADNMYWFYCPVPIPEWDKMITVTLENDEGPVDFKVGDRMVSSYDYSVKTWVDNKKGGTDKDADIAKALEKYGMAAANRFLNGKYSIDMSGTTINVDKTDVTGKKPAGVSKVTQNVNFQEDNSLNILFTLESGKKESDYTWTMPSTAKKTVDGQVVKITIPNIAAPNLDMKHTVAVSDGTDTFTVVSSPLAYALNMAGGKDNAKDPDLMKALYEYCVAAKTYFGAN